jgi:hypothetical protein
MNETAEGLGNGIITVNACNIVFFLVRDGQSSFLGINWGSATEGHREYSGP